MESRFGGKRVWLFLLLRLEHRGLITASVKLSELIHPTELQKEFFQATDKFRFVLFGGSRGPGKSYGLRWAIVRKLLQFTAQGLRNVQAGLFCETFPELRKRQIDPIKRQFPDWLGEWLESEKVFRFKEEYGGHQIALCNLDDPTKYRSAEFAIIAVDELTLLPSKDIFTVLRGSLRWPGVERPVFMAATNPDGPSHTWVKRLWVSRDFTLPEDKKLPSHEFHFIRALPEDNPYLSQTYIDEELGSLPESLRKPWLEGSWDLFEGQRFLINPEVHVLSGARKEQYRRRIINGEANFYRTADYGFDNPYGCLWIAVMIGDELPNVIVYREAGRSGLKAREQAREIKELTQAYEVQYQPMYLDSACWKEEDDGLSIAQKFIQEGIPVQQVLKDRATGWVAIEDLLAYDDEKPSKLAFFDECPVILQQLTDMVWDPKKPGDILHPESFRDDLGDALRYFALTHFRAPHIIVPPKPYTKEHDMQIWRAMNGTSKNKTARWLGKV